MQRSRTIFFLVSSLCLLLAGCSTTSGVKQGQSMIYQKLPVWTDVLRSDVEMNRYQVSIKVKNNTITGMCLLKKAEDGWRGSLVNEFGAKAFDFIVTDKKAKLVNTIPMMDKWYIRKTIASDLYFLFEADNPDVSFQKQTVRYMDNGTLHVNYKKKKSIERKPDGSIMMNNLKYNIGYSLKRIDE